MRPNSLFFVAQVLEGADGIDCAVHAVASPLGKNGIVVNRVDEKIADKLRCSTIMVTCGATTAIKSEDLAEAAITALHDHTLKIPKVGQVTFEKGEFDISDFDTSAQVFFRQFDVLVTW